MKKEGNYMALIKCPECSNQISDKAKICIKCGYPISELISTHDKTTEDNVVDINAAFKDNSDQNNIVNVDNIYNHDSNLSYFCNDDNNEYYENNEMLSYNLFNEKIVVKQDICAYSFKNEKLLTIEDKVYNNYLEKYKKWKCLDDIMENALDIWKSVIEEYAKELFKGYNHIFKTGIEYQEFLNKYYFVYASNYSEYVKLLLLINDTISQFDKQRQMAYAIREFRKETRGRVMPGGFTFTGLVSSVLVSNVLNAAIGGINSISNYIGNLDTEMKISEKENLIFGSKEVHDILTKGIKNDIRNLREMYYELFKILGLDYEQIFKKCEDDRKRAKELFLKMNEDQKHNTKSYFTNILQIHPSYKPVYQIIIQKHSDWLDNDKDKKAFIELGNTVNIDVESLFKNRRTYQGRVYNTYKIADIAKYEYEIKISPLLNLINKESDYLVVLEYINKLKKLDIEVYNIEKIILQLETKYVKLIMDNIRNDDTKIIEYVNLLKDSDFHYYNPQNDLLTLYSRYTFRMLHVLLINKNMFTISTEYIENYKDEKNTLEGIFRKLEITKKSSIINTLFEISEKNFIFFDLSADIKFLKESLNIISDKIEEYAKKEKYYTKDLIPNLENEIVLDNRSIEDIINQKITINAKFDLFKKSKIKDYEKQIDILKNNIELKKKKIEDLIKELNKLAINDDGVDQEGQLNPYKGLYSISKNDFIFPVKYLSQIYPNSVNKNEKTVLISGKRICGYISKGDIVVVRNIDIKNNTPIYAKLIKYDININGDAIYELKLDDLSVASKIESYDMPYLCCIYEKSLNEITIENNEIINENQNDFNKEIYDNRSYINLAINKNDINSIWSEISKRNGYAEYKLKEYYYNKFKKEIENSYEIKLTSRLKEIEEISYTYNCEYINLFTKYLISYIKSTMYYINEKDKQYEEDNIIDMANVGVISALTHKGYMILEGNNDFDKNINKAVEILEISIKRNDPYAMLILGNAYIIGKDIPKNINKAKELLGRAAAYGQPNAIREYNKYFR